MALSFKLSEIKFLICTECEWKGKTPELSTYKTHDRITIACPDCGFNSFEYELKK